MRFGHVIAAMRSFIDPHPFFAADSAHRSRVYFIQGSDVFHFRFVASEFQYLRYLRFCKPGVYPHLGFTTKHLHVDWMDFVHRSNYGQFHFVSAKFQDLLDLLQSKFDVGIFSPMFCACEGFHMIGVYAAFNFAEMMKLHSFWNRPDDQIVEVSMRTSASSKNFCFAVAQKAIATPSADMADPHPARRSVPSIFQHKGVWKFVRVAVDVVFRLAFFISRALFPPSGNGGFSTAATFTKTIIKHGWLPSTSVAWSVI